MNQPIVCKFGGSSAADASCFARIRDIVRANPDRRYVVVSAPGKRFPGDDKVTDLLDICASSFDAASRETAFERLAKRFREIVSTLRLKIDISGELNTIHRMLASEKKACILSRGEYLCARLLAEYLDMPFLDAADHICFDEDGHYDAEGTDKALQHILRVHPRAVFPGFYGADRKGQIHLFTRGGSDITGAIIAGAAKAVLYENWTDVPGVQAVAPRYDPHAPVLRHLSYMQMRLLSGCGAELLHPDSILPAAKSSVPIRVCDTFAPDLPGTMIADGLEADLPCVSACRGYAALTAIRPMELPCHQFGNMLAQALQLANLHPALTIGAQDSCTFIFQSEAQETMKKVLSQVDLRCDILERRGLAMAVLLYPNCDRFFQHCRQSLTEAGIRCLQWLNLPACNACDIVYDDNCSSKFMHIVYNIVYQ